MWTDWCIALLCQTSLAPVILPQPSKYRPFVRRRYFLPVQLNGNIRLPLFLLLCKVLNLCVGRHELPDLPTALHYNVISVFFNSGNKIQILPLNYNPTTCLNLRTAADVYSVVRHIVRRESSSLNVLGTLSTSSRTGPHGSFTTLFIGQCSTAPLTI